MEHGVRGRVALFVLDLAAAELDLLAEDLGEGKIPKNMIAKNIFSLEWGGRKSKISDVSQPVALIQL